MPDVLEPAASGRAKCRGCREKIDKGALRFGEAVPNPFGDGDTTHWYHLMCAADARPDKLDLVLSITEHEVPSRSELERAVAAGVENPKLALVQRAERSPSGRARCRQCRERIEKGALRVAVLNDPDPLAMPSTSFVHLSCAPAHVGRTGLLEKLERVSTDLEPADVDELSRALADE